MGCCEAARGLSSLKGGTIFVRICSAVVFGEETSAMNIIIVLMQYLISMMLNYGALQSTGRSEGS